MKPPRPRGEAITNRRVRMWSETFSGFRHTISDGSIDRWLEQFENGDKDIAARILDSVEFLSSQQISTSFRQILNSLPGWNINEAEREGRWRFVAYSSSSGESGDSMVHKFRLANGLGRNIYNDLFIYRSELYRENLTPDDTVVFIDDFSGSGTQICNNWSQLQELLPGEPTIYLVLVAINESARERITNETDLQVVSQIDLGNKDNIFSEQCEHFTPEEKAKILKYCRRADRRNPKGSSDCGMVLVFAHNIPNNSIPILHTNHDEWEGLFRRYD